MIGCKNERYLFEMTICLVDYLYIILQNRIICRALFETNRTRHLLHF